MKGAAIKRLGRMCKDCAFKKGTDAYNDEAAVQGAADCLAFFGTFHCHTVTDAGDFIDAGPCAGFEHAKQYLKKYDND